MKLNPAIILIAALVAAACGGNGTGESGGDDDSGSGTAARSTDHIDICTLLSDEEITAAIGNAPPKKPTEPAGPFTGCNWGSGTLIVQIAPSSTIITAPAESDCPSAGIGEVSTMCFGSVKFLNAGIHVTVSTIEDITESQMLTVAQTLLPKLQS